MKKALKVIGILGGSLLFCYWTDFAYKTGIKEGKEYMAELKLHEELMRENAKLREDLGI